MNKDYDEIREILSDLTDVTGYVHNDEKHFRAFNTAVDKLCVLIDKIDNTKNENKNCRIKEEDVPILTTELDKYQDALMWCSGSEDFAPGGKAHMGWMKICKSLLKKGRLVLKRSNRR